MAVHSHHFVKNAQPVPNYSKAAEDGDDQLRLKGAAGKLSRQDMPGVNDDLYLTKNGPWEDWS